MTTTMIMRHQTDYSSAHCDDSLNMNVSRKSYNATILIASTTTRTNKRSTTPKPETTSSDDDNEDTKDDNNI